MAILELDSVSKSFGRLQAVNEVSFSVDEGDIYGIAGPNGAGKTTLFNLISGIPFHADSGEVRFQGKNIRGLPGHIICHLGLARTFQTAASFDDLNVEENVRIGAAFGGDQRDVLEEVDRALTYVGMESERHLTAGSLPLYAKKRLMLASAIATRPRLLMLDEPAAGLNQVEYQELGDVMRRLNGDGITIVLIEHVLPLLLSISKKVMILNSGEVVTVGSPADVIANEDVIVAYLGERGRKLLDANG